MNKLDEVSSLVSKYNLSLEEFCLIMEAIPANVFFKDTECRYRMASHTCQMLNSTGDPDFTITGKTDREIQPDKALGEKFYREDREIIRTGESMDYLQEMVFGDLSFYYQITKQPVKSPDGTVLGVVGIIVDMTDQIRLQRALEQYTVKDPMTNIYNRAYYEKREETFGRGERYPVSVIMADCDRLKAVNDTLGHKAGDFLIQSTVSNLRCILPDDAEIVRMGGDEFLVILPDCGEAACRELIEEINGSESRLCVGQRSSARPSAMPSSPTGGYPWRTRWRRPTP